MVTTFVSMATAVVMESAAHITMKSGVSISTLIGRYRENIQINDIDHENADRWSHTWLQGSVN